MFSIEVSNNINKVAQEINSTKPQIELAIVRALNKTALWVKAQASREISEEKQIKLRLIRNRLRVIKANRSSLQALLIAKLYSIRASSLGSIKQTAKGARVGKHQFVGAFVAAMPRNYQGILNVKVEQLCQYKKLHYR